MAGSGKAVDEEERDKDDVDIEDETENSIISRKGVRIEAQ